MRARRGRTSPANWKQSRRRPGIADVDGQIAQLERWSDADRKVTPLKALQGMVWAGGYASGELVAHLYDDAIAALQRWADARMPVYVYSSGSIAAQKLYFSHTRAGDLTAGLAGYFDTTTGPKRDPESYRRIASTIGRPGARTTVPVRRRGGAGERRRALASRRSKCGASPLPDSLYGAFDPVTFDELPV